MKEGIVAMKVSIGKMKGGIWKMDRWRGKRRKKKRICRKRTTRRDGDRQPHRSASTPGTIS
jgi:hypothetical protein